MESRTLIEEKLTHLERHVAEQDAEMYRFGQLISKLQRVIAKQEERIRVLEERVGGSSGAPAGEKPPHY